MRVPSPSMQPANEPPLVSIVLPTYKRAHVLPFAIRSILAQTCPDWELIVVDDNSPDNTAEIVASFADPRIRYLKNDPNLKLPRTLNRGFSLARGEYLTWTSDDNLFAGNAIAKMLERLQRNDCDFVYADYWLFSEQDAAGQPLDLRHDRLPDRVQLEKGNHIGACFMYTRTLYEEIGEYDPELFLVEDYDYFIRAAQRFRLCHIPDALYYFRRDDDTLYLSRFVEVKASDVLVRYKNGLLSEDGLLDAVVELLVRDMDGLANPLLRWTHRLVRDASFRLARLQLEWTTAYLRRNLQAEVHAILRAYASKQATFGESRGALVDLMNKLGRIAYVRP